jgi:hypothetical protein
MVFFLGLLSGLAGQQDSPIFPQTRHRFAQMGLGLYYSHSPGVAMQLGQPLGGQTSFQFAPQSQAAVSISGLHFWGKVDFWINIPVWTHLHQPEPDYQFSRGVETGMKYFLLGNPYESALSPFLGISFNNIGFRYLGDNQSPEDRGAEWNRLRYPLHFGVSKVWNNQHYFELSASYFYQNEIDYFFNREDRRRLGMPAWHLNMGYRYIFDTTLSAEEDFQSGRTEQVTRQLAKDGGLNAFSFALGMSSAFYLKNNAFNAEVSPFLGQPKGVNAYLELGLGYYWHKGDAHLNLAYRNINSRATAYGQEQWMSRTALSLDMYKFIWDYHGFVPFVGISPSLERLQVEVRDGQTDYLVDQSAQRWRLGLVFGWDIRPNRLQSFILRTNLRYFPNLHIDGGGHRFHFDQLEINFIQAVFYLNRIF